MIELDASTVLLQWAVGGMLGCWITTRHREVGLGYGWLLRGTHIVMLIGALLFAGTSSAGTAESVRDIGTAVTAALCAVALGQSVVRRRAGVSGADRRHDERSERVAKMTGIDRGTRDGSSVSGSEFDPRLDLLPLVAGVPALVAAGMAAGGADALAIARTVVGAVFLGLVSDAMLLGHWYLVQPGLPRRHVNEIVRVFLWIWPAEVVVMLWPTGMFSVFSGAVDDGWGGQLGWFWAACAVTTGVLGVVTLRALKERSYSAVMAATGLMYLAILTAFGTDLVARAVLS
ncbi:MAG: hypothetical protein ACKOCE_01310 [Acidimicrobiia bacterium]